MSGIVLDEPLAEILSGDGDAGVRGDGRGQAEPERSPTAFDHGCGRKQAASGLEPENRGLQGSDNPDQQTPKPPNPDRILAAALPGW